MENKVSKEYKLAEYLDRFKTGYNDFQSLVETTEPKCGCYHSDYGWITCIYHWDYELFENKEKYY